MIKNKHKRWQWWLCIAMLSPLILFCCLSYILGGAFKALSVAFLFIDYTPPPKWLVKLVDWANGD
ncbi:hypothetical protein BOX08_gp62 [Pseudoalteromonas phage BS5]|uniref:hypothetical protein n=1 Tax=Pseudoalteromonas phage BS5 TaxID=1874539 RepID=UPI0008197D9E|nr:hypothetical protein BOX08_gp62 [Pseudoalteromonas phage BS5]ANY29627.1 hypothetical protein [Pseudoalteromonas phage BS5]